METIAAYRFDFRHDRRRAPRRTAAHRRAPP
jgi:hypothetical protein